jgi:hypothetical protein
LTDISEVLLYGRVGVERLTGALLDRLTHHVHILSMNGESYRLTQSARRRKLAVTDADDQSAIEAVDPDTGEINLWIGRVESGRPARWSSPRNGGVSPGAQNLS